MSTDASAGESPGEVTSTDYDRMLDRLDDAIEQLTGIVDALADRLNDQRDLEAVLDDATISESGETTNRGFQ